LKTVFRRQVIKDAAGSPVKTSNTLIADNIYSANLTQGAVSWLLSVEAQSGGKSETREYEIIKRLQ
jgi:hypothetical protein